MPMQPGLSKIEELFLITVVQGPMPPRTLSSLEPYFPTKNRGHRSYRSKSPSGWYLTASIASSLQRPFV